MRRYRVIPPSHSQDQGSVVTQPFSSVIPLSPLMLDDHPVAIRGQVERFSAAQGIEGWAVDLTAPERPLRLQLLLGDDVLSECATDLDREDVSAALGHRVVSG